MGLRLLSTVIFFSSLCFANKSKAVLLSSEILTDAEYVLIMEGAFDPLMEVHIRWAEKQLERRRADLVVFLPQDDVHNLSVAYVHRWNMIEEALTSHSRILYPDPQLLKSRASRKSKTLIRWLKAQKKTLKIEVVNDAHLHRHTTSAKSLLYELSPQISLPTPDERVQLQNHFPLSVLRYITRNGLYIDYVPSEPLDRFKRLQALAIEHLRTSLHHLHIWEKVLPFIYRQRERLYSYGDLESIKLGAQDYDVTSHLGTGPASDTYLLQSDEDQFVVKASNKRDHSPDVIMTTLNVHLWVLRQEQINVPHLYYWHMDESWILMEYIDGPSLAEYIVTTSSIEPWVYEAVTRLLNYQKQLYKKSSVVLNLSAENIRIRDHKLYLVDLTTLSRKRYNMRFLKWNTDLFLKEQLQHQRRFFCSGLLTL